MYTIFSDRESAKYLKEEKDILRYFRNCLYNVESGIGVAARNVSLQNFPRTHKVSRESMKNQADLRFGFLFYL